jgi:hypothetical protein
MKTKLEIFKDSSLEKILMHKQSLSCELNSLYPDPEIVQQNLNTIYLEHEKLIKMGYYSPGLLKILHLFSHMNIEDITFQEIINLESLK